MIRQKLTILSISWGSKGGGTPKNGFFTPNLHFFEYFDKWDIEIYVFWGEKSDAVIFTPIWASFDLVLGVCDIQNSFFPNRGI